MAVSAAQVAVATSAVALNTASQDGTYLAIKNAAAVDVFVGPSNVTTSTGRIVAATTGELQVWLKPGDVLFAICASASTVHILRT